MELEKQICSLELAKRLKELGVKQHSYFAWSVPRPERGRTPQERLSLDTQKPDVYFAKTHWGDFYDPYAAFTVAELGAMLPATIGNMTWLNYVKSKNGYLDDCTRLSYDKWEQSEGAGQFLIKHVVQFTHHDADTEADARAKMLIYLIENKLISVSGAPSSAEPQSL